MEDFLSSNQDLFVAKKPVGSRSALGDSHEFGFRNPVCILPGSFNPLHPGHMEMARITAIRFTLPIWFEISLHNVAKDSLSKNDVLERKQQDFEKHGLVFTKAPTFQEKSVLFPKAVFVVGADTIVRINDSKYYKDDDSKHQTFRNWKMNDIQFLVFGRQLDGGFLIPDRVLDEDLQAISTFVPRKEFDMPISSTSIRNSRD